MPRRPTRSVPTVLLTEALSEGDWAGWLADQLSSAGREVRRVTVTGPDPELAAVAAALDGLDPDSFDVVAHGPGCLAWLQYATSDQAGPRPARVALVAPPSPTLPAAGFEGYYPVPLDIDTVRQAADGTVLVGSDNDPRCPGGVATEYGAPLKMATTVLPGAGGMTVTDGYGPWPAVLDWCGRDNLAFRA